MYCHQVCAAWATRHPFSPCLHFLDASVHLSQVTLKPASTACVQSADGVTHYGAHSSAFERGLASSEAGRGAEALVQSSPLLKKLVGSAGIAANLACMRGLKDFGNHDSFDADLHGHTNTHSNANRGVVDDPDVNCATKVRYLQTTTLFLSRM